MSDKEIEKGLECCAKYDGDGIRDFPNGCKQCPYEKSLNCSIDLLTYALAYINRLKAEKAVSDRALNRALREYYVYMDKHENVPVSKEVFVEIGIAYYETIAKQELEKEGK